jgi:hypothetical protein
MAKTKNTAYGIDKNYLMKYVKAHIAVFVFGIIGIILIALSSEKDENGNAVPFDHLNNSHKVEIGFGIFFVVLAFLLSILAYYYEFKTSNTLFFIDMIF